ncbi:MAG: peptidylprolyl isomerase [Desulfobacterales bacterium]|nr:MAG: peptidylprolyl isomerase [Desulfobacterales bacterium]
MAKLFNNSTGKAGKIQRMIFLLLSLVLSLIWSISAGAFSKPVAKVNDTVLTEDDLQQALNEIMPAGVFHGGFSSKKREKYIPQAFEKMIEKELFYQEAVEIGLKIDEEIIKAEREKTIERLGGEKKFQTALGKAGLTDEQYQQRLRKKELVERFITVEISDKALPTDEQIKDYYRRNKQKFMRPEARKLRHILITVQPEASAEERKLKKAQAQEVIDRISAGEDMSDVAWKYSTGPYRVKGGDMGLVHRGRLYPVLEEEIFKLEPGKLSGIIETIYGYHIVRVEEVKAAEQLELKDVYDKIKMDLTKRNEKQIREDRVASLKAQARIEKLSN